jgi:type VI secretion system secreted protein VgrG
MPSDLRLAFECDAFDPADVQVHEVTGVEECSQPFHFHVLLAARDRSAVDVDAMVSGAGALVFTRGGEEVRRVHGMIASVQDVALTEAREYTAWRVHFVPRAYRLTLAETVDIFMDLDVKELIEKKLKGVNLRGDDVEFRLSKKYPKREFVVQYQETDQNFVARQAEHYGITYFFEHGEKDKIVFSDHNEGLKPIEGGGSAPWQPNHINEMGELRVHALECETRALPGRYVVRDYNYRTPGQDLKGGATIVEGAAGEVVEYGTHFKTPEEGQRFAKVRAEELLATRWTYTGKSNVPAIEAGHTFTLEGHPRGDVDLLVTRVEHFVRQAVFGMMVDSEMAYENTFTAIPKEVVWRPARRTTKPIVSGVVTGIVDAATKSNFADVDDEGRYRVKFMYDTAQRGEAQASRPVRMAQPHSGPGYGMHFPLRAGVEVLLTCVNGDPDRPVIMGTVPNPATASPVTKGNQARNIIRTGGGNEMNFDDSDGNHRLKISIPHADTTFQLGSPNSPERGAMLATAESWSAYAGTVASQVSNVSNVFAATAKLFASTDITQFAGISNALDKAEAVMGIIDASADFAKDAAALPKTWSDIGQKAADARVGSLTQKSSAAALELTRAKRDRAVAMAAANQKVAAAEARVALAEAMYGANQSPDPNDPAAMAAYQEVTDAHSALATARTEQATTDTNTKAAVDKADKNKKDAEEAIENDPVLAQAAVEASELGTGEPVRRGTAVAAETAKNITKTVKAAKDIAKNAKTLFSSAAKIAAEAAKEGTALLASGAAAAAGSFGALPRLSGGVGGLGKAWNIEGATGTAALIGLRNTLVASPLKTAVTGGVRVVIGGGSQVLVHSPAAAEVTGLAKVFLTSAAVIDAKSGARIKTFSGASTKMKAVGPFAIETSATMKIKATGSMNISSNPLINARATNIKFKANAAFQVKAANVKVDTSAAIKMKAGSKVEAKVGGSTVRVTSGHVTMAKGGTMAKVTGSNAMMKHGGTKLTLSGSGAKLSGPKAKISGSGGVKITGAKIDLG